MQGGQSRKGGQETPRTGGQIRVQNRGRIRGGALGIRIRERRQMLGIMQKDLARQVGISPSYLNLIEHERRRIGGRLLVSLADALGCSPTELSGGGEDELVSALLEAATADAQGGPELARAEELSVRLPGWAGLIRRQLLRIRDLERNLRLLNDRLAHDPAMAGTLHDVLTVATAIRSSAAILAGPEPPDPEWQARFLRNIREDSRRLADAARGLARLLEAEARGDATQQVLPHEALQAWLERHGHHFAALEPPSRGRPEDVLAEVAGTLDPQVQALALPWLERYRDEAARLPQGRLVGALLETVMAEPEAGAPGNPVNGDPVHGAWGGDPVSAAVSQAGRVFGEAAAGPDGEARHSPQAVSAAGAAQGAEDRDGAAPPARMPAAEPEAALRPPAISRLDASRLDPVALAARLGCPVSLVLSRLAALPSARGPLAGLVACDGAGALIRRQAVDGFILPRHGLACPLWPLFRALSRPAQLIRECIEQEGSHPRRFISWTIAEPLPRRTAAAPERFGAIMLLLPAPSEEGPGGAVRVGAECRLCPAANCDARREPSILGGLQPEGARPRPHGRTGRF